MVCIIIRPVKEINKKKEEKHLSHSKHYSYLVLLSEGHRLSAFFFSRLREDLYLCPLCFSRPAGDSVHPSKSKQLLPREAGRETESGLTEAGARPRGGKAPSRRSLKEYV